MKKYLIFFLLFITSTAAFCGGAGTKFQMYVPPVNENNNRFVCLVVTAFSDSTSVVLTDDGSDGDTDDSWSGILMKGQSYICYIKDKSVNDDAGGKWDGDYFTVTANKPVIVYQSVDSDWEHDFLPSDNGTMTGSAFFVYVNTSPFSNRDINVFTYFDSTSVKINDISVSGTNTTGLTSVKPNPANNIVLNTMLNINQDLINTSSAGRNLLNNGKTYMITTSKPVSVQYGSLYTNSREAGAYVPGRTGSTLDSLFYFNIPSDYKKEQELRIVSYSDNVTLKVEWLNNGSNWVQLQSYTLNKFQVGNFLDNGNQNEDKFRAYTNGGKVSIFEGNYLQSSSGATTADIYSYAASDRGNMAGKNLVVYLPYPNNISNCTDPVTGLKYSQLSSDGLFTHLFIYASYANTSVRIQDNNLAGIIDTTVNLSAGKFYDFKVNKTKYNQLSGNSSTIPYMRLTSTQPVTAAVSNWSGDWMCFANDGTAQSLSVTNNFSKPEVTSGDTCSYFAYVTNPTGAALSGANVTVTIPDGILYQSSSFVSNTQGNLGSGTYSAGNAQSTVSLSSFSLSSSDTLKIKITGKAESNYYTGNPVANGTELSISTLVKGNALSDTLSAQNSSSIKIKNNNPYTVVNNYVLAFEDIKNSAWNDWDVNDFVASMTQTIVTDNSQNITKITYDYEALARGSSYDHTFKHKISLTGSTTVSLSVYDTLGNTISALSYSNQSNSGAFTTTIFPSSKAALPPAGGLFSTNTSLLQSGVKKGYKAKLEITVNNTSNPLSGFTTSSSDPFIITSVGGEIHIASIAGPSGNTQNLDNAALVGNPLYGYYLDLGYQNPNNFRWPLEGPAYPIWEAYPRFTSYITSNKTTNTDWYNFPDTTKVWNKRIVTPDSHSNVSYTQDRFEGNKGIGKRLFQDSISKFFASPKYYDLDGDGKKEVIIGAMDKRMYALKSNGEFMPGFPFPTDGIIRSTAAVDSIQGGKKVIVFGSDDGNIFAIDNNGNLLKGFPFYTGGPVKSSPVIADIYNDGNKEIVAFSGSGNVFVLGFDGQLKNGFPVKVQSTADSYGNLVILSSPAVGDIDNDGSKEIVVGTADSTINVVRADGSIQSGFPVKLDNMIFSSPVISKLNGNEFQIVAASGGGYLYLIKPNGTITAKRQLSQGFISSPIVADMNRDSTKEILIGGTDGNILSVTPDASFSTIWNMQTNTEINSSPVAADVDGDGFPEAIFCGMNGAVFVINKDGVMDLASTNLFSLASGWIISSPAIGDLDGNGKFDVTIASFDETIKTYELPNSVSSGIIQWQYFGKDLTNTKFDGIANNVNPAGNQLGQIFNYPNPVKESTTLIRAELPIGTQDIKLQIFDIGGQLVKTVTFKEFTRNGFYYDYRWDLKNDRGTAVANGAYIYIIKANVSGTEYTKSQKMGVVR
ncbi:MAG: LruC domain-containing protein [Bacteroidetes bacterium]|nr:LruC domain-containing protein [Bacteroidota bacterium]